MLSIVFDVVYISEANIVNMKAICQTRLHDVLKTLLTIKQEKVMLIHLKYARFYPVLSNR
jgi:hypothetical protein